MINTDPRTMVPIYAAEPIPTPQSGSTRPGGPKPPRPWQRIIHSEWFRTFRIRNGIALILILAWAVSMMIGCGITGAVVRHRTTKEVTEAVTSQMRGEFQRYLEEQENARMAAGLITGDESRQAASDEIADALAPLIAGLRMDGKVTKPGAYTYGWMVVSRLHSGRYGDTITQVLSWDGHYEYYDPDHACRPEDREIAAEIAQDYIAGDLPSGFSWKIEFAKINADGSVTARDEFKSGEETYTWRYPE